MAKPINITPALRGKDAVSFFDKLKNNSSKRVSVSALRTISKDADRLRSIAKI